ncbi:MAG TPA: S8 family peptidase [Paenibacillus sp.]|uniref:S8 family peptidase n=1 Tax=Paenibacillus sp. TaxID=58172 RepID=UPI0028D0C93D|nr:S8 family peptidase [Paenibacillus sp.]HUC94131.1 S8 family peptidase [Paenibacillus sp.]
MDITRFLQWLQDAASGSGAPMKRRIIRFQSRSDCRRFIEEWAKHASAQPTLQGIRPMRLIHAVCCELPEDEPPARLAGLCTIEPDVRIALHGSARKSDEFEKGIPWGVRQIKAPSIWHVTTGHRIKVGVIDTGIDFSHPDLRHSVSRGINLLVRSMLPHDDNGHGTHIAGTIAAANRLQGMIGVAPRSLIHPVKAFDHNGTAFVSDIILGIEWCVRHRMDVINMSFGMKKRSKALLTAVMNAYNAGVIIVASSGNDGKNKSIDYPARFPQTVSVGATNKLRRIAPFSNRGSLIDIYAPGDKIVSAWLRGNYNEMSGTSMATSHVSGAIALLLAHRPGLSPAEIKAILKKSTQPLRGSKAPRRTGELDIARMMQAAAQT